MKRTATANWKGGLKTGRGTLSAGSGTFANVPYNFVQRFENTAGTSPEELIAAAHASCYAMALSAELEKAGSVADSVDARATVTLEKTDAGFTVTSSHLDVTARVPGIERAKFEAVAEGARAGCPISRLLSAAKITLEARLA